MNSRTIHVGRLRHWCNNNFLYSIGSSCVTAQLLPYFYTSTNRLRSLQIINGERDRPLLWHSDPIQRFNFLVFRLTDSGWGKTRERSDQPSTLNTYMFIQTWLKQMAENEDFSYGSRKTVKRSRQTHTFSEIKLDFAKISFCFCYRRKNQKGRNTFKSDKSKKESHNGGRGQ